MYEDHFGLKEEPFSIAPDPHYIYMSQGHREALAHLLYGVERDGGFVLLTGEVGTGKTTICRCLLEEVPETTEVAFILNPKLTVEELLATICDEFRITYPQGNTSVKVFVSRINDYLLDVHTKGRRAVLIIEEAQNLSTEVLEQIRLLTNLETNERKLLQIIMVAQPEITEKLSQQQLRQLSQRITARCHLGPLSKQEVIAYVKYRLIVAGSSRIDLFPLPVLNTLVRLSSGVPRLINVICDRALLGAYVQGKDRVDVNTLKMAAREVIGKRKRQRPVRQAVAAFLLLALVSGTAYYLQNSGIFRRGASNAAFREVPRVAAKTEIPPLKPLDQLDYTDPQTSDTAYKALFDEWHLVYKADGGRTACEQAQQQGLHCVQRTGTINDLQQINKPAVLKLTSRKGLEYFVALISLTTDTGAIAINDERRNVPLEELSRSWSGEYILLWQPPPGYRGELKPGQKGAFVTWVERHLAKAQRRPARNGPIQEYNQAMVEQVKEFQRASGLNPDGIVGPWTIMRLSADGNGEPALNSGRSEK